MKQHDKLDQDDGYKKIHQDYCNEIEKIAKEANVTVDDKKDKEEDDGSWEDDGEDEEADENEEPKKDDNKDGQKGLEGVY